MDQVLAAKLKTLPNSPGVYFHKSSSGEVIYVGKAAVLKNRVRQYFRKQKDMDAKTLALVAEIADTDWIETDSEIDALFLESEMIKRYKPRYNILLRDDKAQIFVRINMRDTVPFVSFTRQPADDGADYYGPFYNGAAVKQALRLLRRIFPYYTKSVASSQSRVASQESKLNYQIGLTPGVIEGKMTPAEYQKSLRQLISYIKGNRVAVVKEIESAMKTAARQQHFELAAHYRNQLYNLRELKKQIVFGRDEFLDISKDQGLIGLRDLLNLPSIPRRIEGYDISHQSGVNNVASMVVMTNGLADKAEYRKFKLSNGNDDTRHMRETMVRRLKHLRDWGRPDLIILDGGAGQLSAVADLLNAEQIPFVGRSKSGDHTRNAEVQLVIPRTGIAPTGRAIQGRSSRPSSLGSSLTFSPSFESPLNSGSIGAYETVWLDSNSHVAKLIARLDDEAHRFAVSYHTNLKRTGQIKNALEEIPSIGPVTQRKLIKHFGSLNNIKKANLDEIAKVVGKSKANLIKLKV